MKKLFLHIGTRKTATSSIQKAIYNNREIFEKSGLYYPKNWREAHNLEIYCLFSDHPEKYSFNVFNNYTKEQVEENNRVNRENIINEINNTECENILFSAEDASALSKNNVVNLKKFINSDLNITDVQVIVGVRDILTYITSDLQQLIKDGVGRVNINHYKNLYRAKIEPYIEVFGEENIIVYKFEDSIKHELGPVGYFCDIINVPRDVSSAITTDRTNEGISNKAIDLIEYINLRVPLINNLNLSNSRFKGDTQPLNSLTGNKFIPRHEYQEEVLSINKDDLEWLKSIFSIDYTTTKIKEMYDIEYDTVFVHEILDIYALLTPLIQRLLYDYFLFKTAKYFGESRKNIDTLIVHIQDNFLDVLDFDLNSKLSGLDNVEQKLFPSKDTVINEIRDLAVQTELIDLVLARKLMLLAHEFRKKAIFIKDKLDEYNKKLNNLLPDSREPKNPSKEIIINNIRDLAVQTELIDLVLASKLMLIAHQERPTGPFIKKKYLQYKEQITFETEDLLKLKY